MIRTEVTKVCLTLEFKHDRLKITSQSNTLLTNNCFQQMRQSSVQKSLLKLLREILLGIYTESPKDIIPSAAVYQFLLNFHPFVRKETFRRIISAMSVEIVYI